MIEFLRKVAPALFMVATLAPLSQAQSQLAITGGTIVDVSDQGRSQRDLTGQTILIEDGVITRVGPSGQVTIPEGFHRLDATGKYLTPGLIDGFAVLNNQAYAQAFLTMGVTSIVGVGGGRRGPMFFDADPGPTIYPLDDVGFEERDLDDLLDRVDEIAGQGAKVALLMYRLTPEKLRAVARRCKELGLATIGELAMTGYAEGAQSGIDAFVHTTRYSLGMAGEEMIAGVASEPFSNELGSPKWRYYQWLSERNPESPEVGPYSQVLAQSGAFLMPTASLLYLHQPGVRNPWSYPVSKLIDAGDVNKPADPDSGIPDWTPDQLEAYRALARATEHIETSNRAAGCRYLAGSATDVWGTMPGISLHTELQALVRYGLTPREALASATSNFASAFGWNELGALEAGRRGDVLILDKDPRASVQNLQAIHRVIARGAVLEPQALLAAPGTENGAILDRASWVRTEPFEGQGFEYLDDLKLERITYRSNTLRVRGAIVQPKAPGPYPCVIYLRGGNRDFGRLSDWKIAKGMARMASWGYVVVATEYRGVAGGTGLEQFGGAEVNDVLNLIPLLENLPQADASRMALNGGSRGGMMTFLALKASDRFQAAVVRAGLTDLHRWVRERPGIESVLRELIPGYASDRERVLKERSAVHWAERLKSKAPVLMFHGSSDWRILPGSSLDMAAALQKARHPYRLIMLEGSDHGLNEHRDEVEAQTRAWLDRFVRDGEPAPDLQPHGR